MSSVDKPTSTIKWFAAAIFAMGIVGCGFLFLSYKPEATVHDLREKMSYQFTATTNWIVFPVPLDNDQVALAAINRVTGLKRLISSAGSFLAFPHFSSDGERIIFVRGKSSTPKTELLSCTIADWNCSIYARTTYPIISPVEVRKGLVLFSGSQLRVDRYWHDFYLIENSLEPVRLSTFEFHKLETLNTIDDKIIFAAVGSAPESSAVFPKWDPMSPALSEIFALKIDWKERHLVVPAERLKPLFAIEGFSTRPAVSRDGSRVAYLNRRPTAGRERYNLAVSTMDEKLVSYIEATSNGFSQPAFVGNTVLVNQFFDDRYETTLVDLSDNSRRTVANLDHSTSSLKALEKTEIKISE